MSTNKNKPDHDHKNNATHTAKEGLNPHNHTSEPHANSKQQMALNKLASSLSATDVHELWHSLDQSSMTLKQAIEDISTFCNTLGLDQPLVVSDNQKLQKWPFIHTIETAHHVLDQLQSLSAKDLDKIIYAKDQKTKGPFLNAMKTMCAQLALCTEKMHQYEKKFAICEKTFSSLLNSTK